MAFSDVCVLLLLCNLSVALAEGPVSCFKIELGTVAGVVCVDIILTVAIVVATYYCARNHQHRTHKAEQTYMNIRAISKI
ncbi:unnamed protein product [Knipowitschia caucasica]|uniref:Hematopoietic cell signal transducer n=1 Tax=Knipowitschia caucasica TaxID=637954 RepID=A0AAV2ME63_KNICA